MDDGFHLTSNGEALEAHACREPTLSDAIRGWVSRNVWPASLSWDCPQCGGTQDGEVKTCSSCPANMPAVLRGRHVTLQRTMALLTTTLKNQLATDTPSSADTLLPIPTLMDVLFSPHNQRLTGLCRGAYGIDRAIDCLCVEGREEAPKEQTDSNSNIVPPTPLSASVIDPDGLLDSHDSIQDNADDSSLLDKTSTEASNLNGIRSEPVRLIVPTNRTNGRLEVHTTEEAHSLNLPKRGLAVPPTARAVTSSAAREPTSAADTPEVEEEVTVELESRVVRESTQIVTIQSDNEDDDVLYLNATMDLSTESSVERVGGPGLGYVRDSPTSSPAPPVFASTDIRLRESVRSPSRPTPPPPRRRRPNHCITHTSSDSRPRSSSNTSTTTSNTSNTRPRHSHPSPGPNFRPTRHSTPIQPPRSSWTETTYTRRHTPTPTTQANPTVQQPRFPITRLPTNLNPRHTTYPTPNHHYPLPHTQELPTPRQRRTLLQAESEFGTPEWFTWRERSVRPGRSLSTASRTGVPPPPHTLQH